MRYQIVIYSEGDFVAFESLSSSREAAALLEDTTLGHMENGIRYTNHLDAEKLFILIDSLGLCTLPLG